MRIVCKIALIYCCWTSASIAGRAQSLDHKGKCDAVNLQVLGAGGPEINDGLASSSFLLWIDGKAKVMVDAGGGSSLNFEKSGASFNDIEAILLTHLHVDHSTAIPVYIKGAYFSGRQSNLWILGPDGGGQFPATVSFINALFSELQNSAYPYLADNLHQQSTSDFLMKPVTVSVKGKLWKKKLSQNLEVVAIDVYHGPVPALAWRINYGNCSITFSGDMNGSTGHLEKLAKNSDLLVANNAIPEDAGFIAKRLHMPPSKIGEIAAKANVKAILLAHFMNRTIHRIPETKRLISKQYSGKILIARDLMTVVP